MQRQKMILSILLDFISPLACVSFMMVLRVLYLHKMDDIQQEYRDRMTAILSLRATPKVKSLLL